MDCPGYFRRHTPLLSFYNLPSLFVTVKKIHRGMLLNVLIPNEKKTLTLRNERNEGLPF